MANYDRSILLPYLRDVCTAEMLCAKLERQIDFWTQQKNRLTYQVNQEFAPPAKPDPDTYKDSKEDLAGMGCILMAIGNIVLTLYLWQWLSWLAVGGFVVSAIIIFGVTSSMKEDSESSDRRYRDALTAYERKVKNNEMELAARPQRQAALATATNHLNVLNGRLCEAKKMRTHLYDVNIIPRPYRNIDCAWYLFDYFNTSRETDLDKIVQTLLLDDIRKQVHTIVRQNEEILLNQRLQIAMQEQSNRTLSENHRREMSAMARMEQNQELQTAYQKMILENERMTNFMLAADYMKKS